MFELHMRKGVDEKKNHSNVRVWLQDWCLKRFTKHVFIWICFSVGCLLLRCFCCCWWKEKALTTSVSHFKRTGFLCLVFVGLVVWSLHNRRVNVVVDVDWSSLQVVVNRRQRVEVYCDTKEEKNVLFLQISHLWCSGKEELIMWEKRVKSHWEVRRLKREKQAHQWLRVFKRQEEVMDRNE